jgi:SAM-dependent methyltransferase
MRADGLICDLGCGPGHVARYLHERGADVCGIDISPGMIAQARRLTPGLRFEVGDMRALSFADETVGAVVAMYSLIHLDQDDLGPAIHEIARVLIRNGILLAGFHSGNEVRHVEELWGHQVELDFHFFEPAVITNALEAAGLNVVKCVEREPYAGVEVETNRFYVVAAKPGH